MKEQSKKQIDLSVTFVGIKDDEQAPQFAAYQLDSAARPIKKIGGFDGKKLKIELGRYRSIAFGPDVEDFKTLPKESLAFYRVAQNIKLWQERGIVLARKIWECFHFHYVCVSGTVRKCRPWIWDVIDDIRYTDMLELAQEARIKPINAELQHHLLFPFRCLPLCDGVIEIYERKCCCHHIHIPSLLDRLREIFEVLPIPIPDPIPDPIPGPIPGPDPAPFTPQLLRKKARAIQRSNTNLDLTSLPPENLYQDYLALSNMSVKDAQIYVKERAYLYPLFCHCSVRKVGQTPIQPGGEFDFCYLTVHQHPHLYPHSFHSHCYITYAYKVKQLINGVLTTVYDGLAANQYFVADNPADIRTYNPQAIVCADGPGDPPPNEGDPFVMLEHIGEYGSFHFNFPVQTGVSQMGALDPNDGTYTTSYAPDCPWGGGLGLRLWFSPELEPIVKYYRIKACAVNDAGSPIGTPVVLNNSVTWDKLVDIPGDLIRAPETLGPLTVNTENDLFKVPYWSSPNHRYLNGQFHQVWNTAQSMFPDGKYILIVEVFDSSGNRVKPNGATGPGTGKNFQFRRWTSAADTDNVSFADMAHIFWIDNTPVGGDVVNLRKSGVPNTAECQFMTGTANDTFAIGFRAYHVNGVEHAGNGDDNSFMYLYNIRWQRGLNGNAGYLGPAPGNTNHTDVGETGVAVASGSETFQNMLTQLPSGNVLSKCTFSVRLRVFAKHFTGVTRIRNYDYNETASFALEIGS